MLVLSMVLVLFAACSGEPAKTQQKPTGGEKQTATNTAPSVEKDDWGRDKVDSSLPADLNFGGETVNIFVGDMHYGDLYTDALNDDIINDAVYNRNIKVEEDLGVELNWILYEKSPGDTSFANTIDASVFNDTGDYDIAMGYGYFLPSVVPLMTYINLYDVPYLDFEKPWWNQIYVENATLNDQMYTCVGDLSLASTYNAGCIFFNKRLANEHYADIGGAEGIYKLVIDGKWTMDKFTEIVKDKWIDSDGDGQKSEGDFFAFGSIWSGPIPCDSFQYGMDAPITRDDENGVPYLTYNTEKTVNALNKLYTLAYECDGVLSNQSYYNNSTARSMLQEKFTNASMIFYAYTLSFAKSLGDMKDDYGLLPMPKFDEAQEAYYTSQSDTYTAFAIPAGIDHHNCSDGTTTRDYLAGAVLEKLNEESYRTVAPNYFEVVMKYRYIRSENSEDYDLRVYDMILAGNNFNFGLIYSCLFGNPSFKFRHMIGRDASNDFASMWNAIETDVTNDFEYVVSYFTEV